MARIDLYQLDEFNDDFSPNVVGGDIPVWDAITNNGQFTPKNIWEIIFGQYYYHYKGTNVTSTNSPSPAFTLHETYTTPDTLPAGTYRIACFFVFSTANTQSAVEAYLTANGTNLCDQNFIEAGSIAADGTRQIAGSTFFFHTLASPAALTVNLYVARAGSPGQVTAYGNNLEIMRIS